MGLRVYLPSGTVHTVIAFTKRGPTAMTIQLVCDVQAAEHSLRFARSPRRKTAPQLIIEFSVEQFRAVAVTDPLKESLRSVRTTSMRKILLLPLPLDAEMNTCIYSITHLSAPAETQSLFLYARAIELLYLQQESYHRSTRAQAKYIKSEYDRERIVFARDYLLTHLDAPPSLSKLAVIAGINEFKLKRGFRELFNQSVFAYLADVRLNMARTALQQKQKTVTQIAFELGYASLQHFSAAFRKKYGVPPGRYE